MGRFLYHIIFVLISFTLSHSQLIGVKTIPVAEIAGVNHIYSSNSGMGGVTIAIDDWALDPFARPAKGRNIKGLFAIGSPTFSSVSEDIGSTKILPLTILFGDSLWFGGFTASFQANEGRKAEFRGVSPAEGSSRPVTGEDKDNYRINASFGRKFIDRQAAVGASFSWANMNFLPGVDLLYGRNDLVKQSGHIYDLRLGVNGWLDGNQTWDITVVFNRIDMKHKIESLIPWFMNSRTMAPQLPPQTEKDVTDTYGVSLEYTRPFYPQDWQAGLLLTLNYKNHPKIPNYTLMNIPRDPGNSVAGNIGIGLSKKSEAGALGIDLIYEPIRSRTWADAAEEIITRSGKKIYPGQKTVYNYFDISNWIVRMGFSEMQSPLGIQLGLSAHRISYRLDQKNYITEINRSQYEKWIEFTGTFGLRLRLSGFTVHYSGSITTGTGIPGTQSRSRTFSDSMNLTKSNFIVAPAGSLSLDEHEIFTHQVALVIPLFNQ